MAAIPRKKRFAEDEAKLAAAQNVADVKTVQAEIRKPGSELPLQQPRPDVNPERLALRREQDQKVADMAAATAGRPYVDPDFKGRADIANRDLEAAAAHTSLQAKRENIMKYGALAGEGADLRAAKQREINIAEGPAAAGARLGSMRAPGRGGYAGIGPPELPKPEKPSTAFDPKLLKEIESRPPTPAALRAKAVGEKKKQDIEAGAVKEDTRAKERTASAAEKRTRAAQHRKLADTAAATAKTPEDMANVEKLNEIADNLDAAAERDVAQADIHEKTATDFREGGISGDTVRRIMREKGVDEPTARRIMQYGDIGPGSAARRAGGDLQGDRRYQATKDIATGRAAIVDRGQELRQLSSVVSLKIGKQQVAVAYGKYQRDEKRGVVGAREEFDKTYWGILEKAAERGDKAATAATEQRAEADLQTQKDVATTARQTQAEKARAATAAKPVKPDIVYIGDVPHTLISDGAGGYIVKPIQAQAEDGSLGQAPAPGTVGVYGQVAGQPIATTPSLGPTGQPIGVPGAWKGSAPPPAPAPAPTAPAAAPVAPAPAAVTGKPLDAATAQRLLNEAGGDKNKARAAAQALGYSL